MNKRLAVLGLAGVLTLALAIPALGGPSNPIATVAKSVKRTAKKALKKANKANKTANKARKTANSNATKLTCPSATVYVLGGCLETAVRAPAVLYGAAGAQLDCLDEGRRLPSIAERQQAHVNGKLPVTASEWTNSPAGAAVVSSGEAFPNAVGSATAYRCATAPSG